MHKKMYLFSFATVLWLALSAFYNGPAEAPSRMARPSSAGLSEFYPAPLPPCDGLSTESGDFPAGQMTQWTVPAGVTEVDVIAIGGDGGPFEADPGSSGAIAQATLPVNPGDVLNIIVAGTAGQNGGGGGTGIYNATTGEVLIVAGGGGGRYGQGGSADAGDGSGGEGIAGGGGGGAFSAGGDGALSDLTPIPGSGGGQGIPNGGAGGTGPNGNGAFGFGGGGAGGESNVGGGGGGYSGGRGGYHAFGTPDGGGSFVHASGTNTAISAGTAGSGINGAGAVFLCYTPASCPPGDVFLYTQAEVEAFALTYPNCTEIAGNLLVSGENSNLINDLSGLSAITSITGYLVISFTNLTSLDGLDNLTSVGIGFDLGIPTSILLLNNPSLADIGAFSNLTSLPGAIILAQGSSLTNLNGFSNLSSVGGLFLFVETSLTSLAGLENVTSYGGIGLAIQGTSALSSLDGLNDAATFANIDIEYNPLLSACGSPAICNHLAGGGPAVIQDNAPGCSSLAEVEAACFPCDIAIDNIAPTAESCPGADDGSLTVSASCTTCSGIEYSIDGLNFQPGNTFSGLAPNSYTVTVRDAGSASCEAIDNTTVDGGPTTDNDNDGTPDCNDGCPSDPGKIEPGACGCGIADTDTDGDGIADCIDACPNDPDNDADGDGLCADADNCPDAANADQADLDLDGLGDACDPTLDVCGAIAGLIAEVEALNLDGGLENALTSKLENALSSFGNGNNNAATGKLGAFINQVQAQSGKKINSADAAALIAKAQAIIAAINSGNTDCGSAARVAPGGVVAAQSREALQLEAFPNPFTQQVTLQYYLPADGRVQLSLFSVHGQEVAKVVDGQQAAGLQRVEWRNDTGLPVGVYFARLQTDSGVSTLQLVLTK